MGWGDSLLWEVPRWCLWALLAPIVTYLVRRYPLRKENAPKRILLHSVLGAAISLLHLFLFVLTVHFIRMSLGDSGRFLDLFLFAFTLDFHVGVAVYWLLLLLRQSKDTEQRLARLQVELTQAQLQALKMQLHPHFLFNTLNSISSFLRTDVETADEMIGRLGDFLRLTLQNPGAEEILLEKEVEFLRHYLEIEQLRFQDRLYAEFEIAPDTLRALVPNLILQPIVENAVRHGVSQKAGKGTIRIVSRRSRDSLQIVISDTGPGIPEKIIPGIGITATRDRMQRMYGELGRFHIGNDAAGGTIVTVEMPFRGPEET